MRVGIKIMRKFWCIILSISVLLIILHFSIILADTVTYGFNIHNSSIDENNIVIEEKITSLKQVNEIFNEYAKKWDKRANFRGVIITFDTPEDVETLNAKLDIEYNFRENSRIGTWRTEGMISFTIYNNSNIITKISGCKSSTLPIEPAKLDEEYNEHTIDISDIPEIMEKVLGDKWIIENPNLRIRISVLTGVWVLMLHDKISGNHTIKNVDPIYMAVH